MTEQDTGFKRSGEDERKEWHAKANELVRWMRQVNFERSEGGTCDNADCKICSPSWLERRTGFSFKKWWMRRKMVAIAKLMRSLPLDVSEPLVLKIATHFYEGMLDRVRAGELLEVMKRRAIHDGSHVVVFTPVGFVGLTNVEDINDPFNEVVKGVEAGMLQAAPPETMELVERIRAEWRTEVAQAEAELETVGDTGGFTLTADTPVAGRA